MATKAFVIEMNMSLEGLHGYQEGSSAQQVFYMMLLQFLIAWAKQRKDAAGNGGAELKYQKAFFKIRKAMEDALKVKETSFNLDPEEMDFLNQVRNEVKLDFEANEAVMRVNDQIDKAIKNYESKYGKGASA